MPQRTPRRRLADVIERERRRRRGPKTNVEFARLAHLSSSQVDIVTHGRGDGGYSLGTLDGIDQAMGWVSGTAEEIMGSAAARPSYLADLERDRQEWLELFDRATPGQRRLGLQNMRNIVRTDM